MSTTPRYQDPDGDLLATVVLFGFGALVLVGWELWLAGHLTILLTEGGWTQAPLPDAGRLIVELARNGDPVAAWAAAFPQAAPLRSPFWFCAFTLLLLRFTGIIAAAGLMVWRGHVLGSRSTPARWATRRHEAPLVVPYEPERRRWRLVAGKSTGTRRLLAGDDCVSAVVFGPNGSGKTTSLIVPNVLDWDGPVVLTTAKPQDLEPICTARATRGPVWVIAPGGAPGHETTGWSPVAAAIDDDAADRVAEWLVESSGMTGDPKSRPWNAQARKYLKGLLLAAHLAGGSLRQWTDWLYAGERARDQVEDILRLAGHDTTALEYASTWQIHEEGKGSVLFTAMGLADTYTRPGVRIAAETGSFTAAQLLDTGGTLCIVTPSGEGDRFAPYFTALVSSVIHEAETRAATSGGPLTPRLFLALDEAGNVFRYPRLPHLLTTSRGNGIQLMLVYHDLAQVEHLYGGREVARTVLSNAKMRLLLPGVGDLETLKYWSDLLGRTRTQTYGETTGRDGHRSRSRNEHDSELAPLHVLQQLPDGQAVLIYQNLPPTRVQLLPWFRDKRFKTLRDVGSPT